jgi:hypothetical protein
MTKFLTDRIRLIGIIILAFWLVRPWLFRIISIDFLTMDYARTYRQIWLFLLPISCLLIFHNSWSIVDKTIKKVLRFVLIAASSLAFVTITNFVSSFCEWNLTSPFYKNKFNDSFISGRHLDCGAFDSDRNFKTVEAKPFLHYFYKYRNVETKNLDPNEWTKTE